MPGPAGPASAPTGNPGEMAAALAKVREGVRIIEKALPGLQVGSKQHDAVISAISKLNKAIPETEAVPGIQNTALAGLQRDAQEGSQMQMLKRMMGGGAGGMPGGAPQPQMPPGAAPGM